MLYGEVDDEVPDSRLRDRLLMVSEVSRHAGLAAIARAFGASGYVVDSVPLVLVAAWHMVESSFEKVLDELTPIGGDTDTIASIAGQIAGARLGAEALPARLLSMLPERDTIEGTGDRFAVCVEAVSQGERPGAD